MYVYIYIYVYICIYIHMCVSLVYYSRAMSSGGFRARMLFMVVSWQRSEQVYLYMMIRGRSLQQKDGYAHASVREHTNSFYVSLGHAI